MIPGLPRIFFSTPYVRRTIRLQQYIAMADIIDSLFIGSNGVEGHYDCKIAFMTL